MHKIIVIVRLSESFTGWDDQEELTHQTTEAPGSLPFEVGVRFLGISTHEVMGSEDDKIRCLQKFCQREVLLWGIRICSKIN